MIFHEAVSLYLYYLVIRSCFWLSHSHATTTKVRSFAHVYKLHYLLCRPCVVYFRFHACSANNSEFDMFNA